MAGDRVKRLGRLLFWRRMLASTAFDLLIAIGLVWYFRSDYEEFEWLSVGLVFLALWGIQLAMIMKNSLAELAMNHFVDPKSLKAVFLEVLREMDAPSPSPDYPARFDYLGFVSEDDTYLPITRVRAASVYASWTAIKQMRGLFASIMIETAWDEAVAAYNIEVSGRDGSHLRTPAYNRVM